MCTGSNDQTKVIIIRGSCSESCPIGFIDEYEILYQVWTIEKGLFNKIKLEFFDYSRIAFILVIIVFVNKMLYYCKEKKE